MPDTLAGRRDEAHGDRLDREPSVFPTGPSPDHPTVPLGRRWHVAGTVIGAITIVIVAALIGAVSDDDATAYRDVPAVAVEIDAVDDPSILISVQVDPALPETGRIRVDGDDFVRVDVTGDALCTPASGTAGAWIDVRFCGPLDVLTATAHDIDDRATKIVATF